MCPPRPTSAARRLGLPIVIHEQNVLPGLANRLAARLTSHVYTSFPQTALPHARCIGLPMRRAITDLDRVALQREARIGFELHPELPTLLVSGGSQGAMRINTAVAGAWPELLAQGIQVLHVLGPKEPHSWESCGASTSGPELSTSRWRTWNRWSGRTRPPT